MSERLSLRWYSAQQAYQSLRDAFARYRACVDAGFTPAQALEMVIRKGIE